MRKARAALALLLAFAVPVRAETTTDPLWYLLSTFVLAPDTRAVEAQADGPADAKGLAALQADLLVLTDGFESFRDDGQVKETLGRLQPRMSPELKPFFKDRASSLDAIYRTLAVTDYTWAQRFPDPPCEPIEARRKLLDGRDGLFQTGNGEASPWLVSMLGPRAQGKSASQALDQASSRARLTGAQYERLRARVRKLTLALASEKAVGAARAKLYCARAEAFADLAASHREKDAVLISAGRAVAPKPEESVFVVVSNGRRAAATLLATKTGAILVTDAAIVADTDHPNLFAFSKNGKPLELTAKVVRRQPELGAAVLVYSENLTRPALGLASEITKEDDLVTALGHTMVSGLWTRTSGLVTNVGEVGFQTDAAISPELSGGPVLNEAGEVAGVLVLRPADTEEGRWPVAIPAAILARWLDDPASVFSAAPATEAIEDAGTAAVLSRARPSGLTETGLGAWNIPNLPPPPSVPRGVCVANCGGPRPPSSSYSRRSSSNAGTDALGEALGELALAVIFKGVPALFRGIGKLFKRDSKESPGLSKKSGKQTIHVNAEPPPKPKIPLKPMSMTLTTDKGAASRGETIHLIAAIEFSGEVGSKAGFAVTFTADSDLFEFPSGSISETDSFGRASVEAVIKTDAAEDAHQGLDREERRHSGEFVEPRTKIELHRNATATTKVKFAALKGEDALDAESEKIEASKSASAGSSLKDSRQAPHEAGVNLPPATSHGSTVILGAGLGGTRITASRPFNLRKQGTGTATATADDEARPNDVNIHTQINGRLGKSATISRQEKPNVTVPMGLAMLKQVELETRLKLRNNPRGLRGFEKALRTVEHYLRNHSGDDRISISENFGVGNPYRLDLEITGRYPFRAESK